MHKAAIASVSLLLTGVFLGTGCSPKSKEVVIPDAPDAAMRVIADELAAGKAGVLWAAMPASYQLDLTGVVREAGTKVDAEVYNGGFAFLKRLADVAEKQRAFILATPMLKQVDKAKAEANWPHGVAMVRALATSQLATAEGLRSFEGEQFLSTTGSAILALAQEMAKASGEDLFAKLKAVKFTASDVTATSASIKAEPEGKPGKASVFTKIEGRWVPAEMAGQWTAKMEEAKKNLAAMTLEDVQKNKPQVMGALAMANGVLTQLEEAKTQAEFDAALQNAMMPLMGLMMMGQQGLTGGAK
jgi:hypothetical protein